MRPTHIEDALDLLVSLRDDFWDAVKARDVGAALRVQQEIERFPDRVGVQLFRERVIREKQAYYLRTLPITLDVMGDHQFTPEVEQALADMDFLHFNHIDSGYSKERSRREVERYARELRQELRDHPAVARTVSYLLVMLRD